MKFISSLISLVVFSFISKDSFAFTYRCCDSNKECLPTIYSEEQYNSETVLENCKFFSYDYVTIDLQNKINSTISIDFFLTDIKNDLSSHTIRFENVNGPIILQTNLTLKEGLEIFYFPTIDAEEYDFWIDNINPESKHNYVYFKYFHCHTIASINEKQLFLFGYVFDVKNQVNTSSFYTCLSQVRITTESEYNYNIMLEPHIVKSTKDHYEKWNEFRFYDYDGNVTIILNTDVMIYLPNGYRVKIRTNDYQRVHGDILASRNTVIRSEDYTSPEFYIFTDISCYEDNVTITGRFPRFSIVNLPDTEVLDGFLINNKIIHAGTTLKGKFLYSANDMPITNFSDSNSLTLNLVESSTSMQLVGDNYNPIYQNITINAPDSGKYSFRFTGGFMKSRKYKEYSYSPYKETFIISNSSSLTIIPRIYDKINFIGPAKILYEGIDNTLNKLGPEMAFLNGGLYQSTFGANFSVFSDLKNRYQKLIDDLRPGWNQPEITVAQYWDALVNYTKENINDISNMINNLKNKFTDTITVEIEKMPLIVRTRNKLKITRTDLPLTPLYDFSDINKSFKILCLKEGTIDTGDWILKFSDPLFNGFSTRIFNLDNITSKFFPDFSHSFIKNEFSLSDDKRCITFSPKNLPLSNFEIIVYTRNPTFIEILSKIDKIILLKNTFTASSKLKNLNTKNFIIFVLDDLPNGASINMNGIRKDANIFLFGLNATDLDDLLDPLSNISSLSKYQNIDFNSEEMASLLHNFTSKYPKYQVKASVNFSSVQSFATVLIDYQGDHINCTNFYPILSTFSSLDSLKIDFTASNTLTDSITMKKIMDLHFENLVILPISLYPLNLLSVKKIDFIQEQWDFVFDGLNTDQNYAIKDTKLSILTSHVSKELYLYSITSNCVLNVPKNDENQVIKGINLISQFDGIKINQVPGIMLLENSETGADSDKSRFDFSGNWNKVQKIEGKFEINAADEPILVDNVPDKVLPILDVKNENNMEMKVNTDKIVFTQPVITNNKKILAINNENPAFSATFNNITFDAGDHSSYFYYKVNDENKPIIVDNLCIGKYTKAIITDNDVTVKNIEIGPQASIDVDKNLQCDNCVIQLNYRIHENFGAIPSSITEPSSIILNYIGEYDNIAEFYDFSNYYTKDSIVIRPIIDDTRVHNKEDCEKWVAKTKLISQFYPEFREENKLVVPYCHNYYQERHYYGLKITTLLNGTLELPQPEEIEVPDIKDLPPDDTENPDDPGKPSDPEDPEKPSDSGNSEPVNPGDNSGNNGKNGLPVGGIVGIVIGVIVVVAVVSFLIWYFVFHKKKLNSSEGENPDENQNDGI